MIIRECHVDLGNGKQLKAAVELVRSLGGLVFGGVFFKQCSDTAWSTHSQVGSKVKVHSLDLLESVDVIDQMLFSVIDGYMQWEKDVDYFKLKVEYKYNETNN